jgi:uncharacterized membrane protein YfcA
MPVQSVSGVGFAMVATPFLLTIMNVKDAVLIGFSMAWLSQIVIVYRHRSAIHPQMCFNFVFGSAVGAPFGLWIFSASSFDSLKLIVCVALFSIALYSLCTICRNWRTIDRTVSYRLLQQEASTLWDIKEFLRWGRSGRVQLIVGSIAGFFGASIGMPGIPLTVYFNTLNVEKDVARSTSLAFFIVLLGATLAMNWWVGTISPRVLAMAPWLIPAVLIGMVVGNLVFPHIPQRWFQLTLNMILLYSGCKIFVDYLGMP